MSNIVFESPNRWNKSTYLDKKLVERRQMENFIHDPSKRYAFNYRAEELETLKNEPYFASPNRSNGYGEYLKSSTSSSSALILPLVKTSKKVEEMPNSHKLLNAKPWNFEANYSGQSLLASKAMHKVNSEKTLKAIERCKAKHDKLLTNYIDPTQSTTILQNVIREIKRDGNFKNQLSLGCRTTSLHSSHQASTSSLLLSTSHTKDNYDDDILNQTNNNSNNNNRSHTTSSYSLLDNSAMSYSVSNMKKNTTSRGALHTTGGIGNSSSSTFNHTTGRDNVTSTWGSSGNNHDDNINNHTTNGLDSFNIDASCKSIYSTTSSVPPAICHYSNRKSRVVKTTEHSGVWEFNTSEQRYMWSDTGSFVYDSPGDVVVKTDPDAYNFVDSTMKYTVHTVT